MVNSSKTSRRSSGTVILPTLRWQLIFANRSHRCPLVLLALIPSATFIKLPAPPQRLGSSQIALSRDANSSTANTHVTPMPGSGVKRQRTAYPRRAVAWLAVSLSSPSLPPASSSRAPASSLPVRRRSSPVASRCRALTLRTTEEREGRGRATCLPRRRYAQSRGTYDADPDKEPIAVAKMATDNIRVVCRERCESREAWSFSRIRSRSSSSIRVSIDDRLCSFQSHISIFLFSSKNKKESINIIWILIYFFFFKLYQYSRIFFSMLYPTYILI